MLVVDDEKNIRATLAVCLEQIGCDVVQAAVAAIWRWPRRRGQRFDLAFVDLRLGDGRAAST